MNQIGIYCSDNATRIKLFFADKNRPEKYLPSFVLYDGDSIETFQLLQKLLPKTKIIHIYFDKIIFKNNAKKSNYLSHELLKAMNNFNADYLMCFGNKILKKPLIEKYKNKIINFHPSLLPNYKGLYAIDKALKAGAKQLGNTAHFITEKIDDGPIICQTILPIEKYSTYNDVLNLQIPMLEHVWSWVEKNELQIENEKVTLKNGHQQVFYF